MSTNPSEDNLPDDLDLAQYTRSPRTDAPTGITLAQRLEVVALPKPPPAIKRSLGLVVSCGKRLQTAWSRRDTFAQKVDSRPIDQRADNAWSCLYGRFDNLACLPHDEYPRAKRASILRDSLFPDRLTFVTREYAVQWAEADKRVRRIKDEGLQKEIDDLCGPECLAEIKRTHAEYAQMVGVATTSTAPAALPSVSEPLRALHRAITAYSLQLVALYLESETSDATRDAIRAALRPLDDLRASASRPTSGGDQPDPSPAADPTDAGPTK